MADDTLKHSRPHVLTVALEDYFHVGAFNRLIQHGQWYRFERRVEQATRRTLDLLDEHGARATFFVLGWIAEHLPSIVREVAERGHEVASKGYYHRSIRQMTPGEFRDDLARSREALQRASGQRILGYRVADEWFRPADIWALDVLAEEGYEYDSSVAPMLWNWSAEPWRRFAHTHSFGDRQLWEFPISTLEAFGAHVPIGGNWLRQLPPWLTRSAFNSWAGRYNAPFILYFHTWEMDPEQPKISAAPRMQRVRQYRNLRHMPSRVAWFLRRQPFGSAADYLGLATALEVRKATPIPATLLGIPPQSAAGGAAVTSVATREQVTVVVPCFNEELILPYLSNTLRSVEASLSPQYELHYVFVDDASTDGTWAALSLEFGAWPRTTFVRQAVNRGVAAAIMRGLRAASTEIACSIDCDCTYDPHELGQMIPLLTEGMDLVVASPYHPDGAVRNVPGWRLFLSRGLSRLYRLVLHHKIATYTSCFRVYRRRVALSMRLDDGGFIGVAELLGRLDLAGGRIVEFPTTLEVRMLGRSKMKIVRMVAGHIGLLGKLARLRLRSGKPPRGLPPPQSGAGIASRAEQVRA